MASEDGPTVGRSDGVCLPVSIASYEPDEPEQVNSALPTADRQYRPLCHIRHLVGVSMPKAIQWRRHHVQQPQDP